jgi:hypothetical protein
MQSSLLAVHGVAAKSATMLIFALALTQAAPSPLTDIHQRDIGCVAALALLAFEQNSGRENALTDYPDVRQTGKRWAGLVGARVMDETGQPQELVAFAIEQAVKSEQAQSGATNERSNYKAKHTQQCIAIMNAELFTAGPLPVPGTR